MEELGPVVEDMGKMSQTKYWEASTVFGKENEWKGKEFSLNTTWRNT